MKAICIFIASSKEFMSERNYLAYLAMAKSDAFKEITCNMVSIGGNVDASAVTTALLIYALYAFANRIIFTMTPLNDLEIYLWVLCILLATCGSLTTPLRSALHFSRGSSPNSSRKLSRKLWRLV